MNGWLRGTLLLLAGVIGCGQAMAQTLDLPSPPIRSTLDERGVDLTGGGVQISDSQLSIGTRGNGLTHTRYWPGKNGWRHGYMISSKLDPANSNRVILTTGDSTVSFTKSGGVFASDEGDNATLIENTSSYTYTSRDGQIIYFDKNYSSVSTSYYGVVNAVATWISEPTGPKTYLTYKILSYVGPGGISFYVTRLQSVRSASGFQLKYTYATNSLTQSTADNWARIASVKAINNAVEYCDPAADSCSVAATWPSVSYALTASGTDTIEAVTDPESRVRRYTTDSAGKLKAIRRPSSASNNITYNYDANNRIDNVVVANVGTWDYNFSLVSTTLTATVATPTIPVAKVVVTDTTKLQPTSIANENGYQSTFTYDAKGRVLTAVAPEGNYVTYTYDTRGNVLTMVATPKAGSGLSPITTFTATYPSTCTTPATCNKPTTTADAAGKITNYYYNSNGSLDYVRAPAPSVGAARPEVHYDYNNVQAWLKNASGNVVLMPDIFSLPLRSTTCVTGAWPCAAANQQITEFIYYGGPSATNLLLEATTVKSGSGSPTTTTGYGYDTIGNLTRVTDPTGNETTMAYESDRQLLSVKSPSIDGSPTSRRRVLLMHYNGDGLVDSRSSATVNPDGSGYLALQIQAIGYDAAGRKTYEGLSDGATTFAATQYSYNGAGRLDCMAQRMNPATFGSLPGACSLAATGSHGPDRITKNLYEYAGGINTVTAGYNTPLARTEVGYERTLNGQITRMVDGKGNGTRYVYDGHDRLIRTCYNNVSATACANGTAADKVQLGYDSVGRVANRGLRGHSVGITIGYGYDDLGRVKTIDYPGSSIFDSDVTLAYDNLGQLLSATDANTHTSTFAYDALGNAIWQGDSISTRVMEYDAAGRRTRMYWSPTDYLTYHYNNVGEMTAIKEKGVDTLATFEYDDLGRRKKLTRGNGVVTDYGYDGASRLTSLVNNLSGTTHDLTLGFTYNPAGQIATRAWSNGLYAWAGHVDVDRPYTTNALNQYTASGSVTPTYDVKGNLASAGGSTYTYSTKNELVQTSDTGKQFYYDPLGRMDTLLVGGATSQIYQYDGNQISTELASNFAVQRRYVWGPGADEVLVWYEGSALTAANRRYPVADERGSVIAVTNNSGTVLGVNTYDDHGIPGTGNIGRFQYTGQAWIPELGMYSYKARIYSPTLGRFMQTDPIGYADGMNWYDYVGGDPVNKTDPFGLEGRCDVDGGAGDNPTTCGGQIYIRCPGCIVVSGKRLDDSFQNDIAVPSLSYFANVSSSQQNGDDAEIIVTAYNGKYHDIVANDLASMLNASGVQVVREFGLCLGSTGVCARPDIFGIDPKTGQPFFIEVKTGLRPRWTPNQLAVYSHTGANGAYKTFDGRASSLGLPMGSPLPAVSGFLYYKKDANTPGVTAPIGF